MDGDQLHEKYQLWWSNRTQDEYKLHETIIDYDEYFFEDMAFWENSLCWNIYSFISENMEELYLALSSSKWMYRFLIVEDNSEFKGRRNTLDRTISVARSYIHDKKVILHEMIHAHENILDSTNYSVFDENLLITLYQKLSSKISDLD